MSKLDDMITHVRELYREGLTVQQIAHVLDINPDFVKEQVKAYATEDYEAIIQEGYRVQRIQLKRLLGC